MTYFQVFQIWKILFQRKQATTITCDLYSTVHFILTVYDLHIRHSIQSQWRLTKNRLLFQLFDELISLQSVTKNARQYFFPTQHILFERQIFFSVNWYKAGTGYVVCTYIQEAESRAFGPAVIDDINTGLIYGYFKYSWN